MGGQTPGFHVTTVQTPAKYRINEFGESNRVAITLLSTAVDAGSTPTTTLRTGLVVGKNSANKFLEAVGAAVTKSAAATLASTKELYDFAGGANQDFSMLINGEYQKIVFKDASQITAASAVVMFNSQVDSRFAVASATASAVVITTAKLGGQATIEILAGGGVANTYLGFVVTPTYGTYGDYGILTAAKSTLDPAGVAEDTWGEIDTTGIYDSTELHGITPDAKLVLSERDGAIFR